MFSLNVFKIKCETFKDLNHNNKQCRNSRKPFKKSDLIEKPMEIILLGCHLISVTLDSDLIKYFYYTKGILKLLAHCLYIKSPTLRL